MDIKGAVNGLTQSVQNNLNVSTSPDFSFHSPSWRGVQRSHRSDSFGYKHLKPFATEDIKILLLENINQAGQDILAKQGYQVESLNSSIPEDELIEKIR